MQAIQIDSFLPDTAPYTALKVKRVPRPKPKHDEVLIRVTHVSLHQVDLLFARGKHQNNNAKHGHVRPPFILGLDFAGVVASASEPSKKRFQIGDVVMGQNYNAFAEYVCVPLSSIMKVPPNLSRTAASTLSGGTVSYGAVRLVAKVEPGQTVLVTGANGGLGAVACQVAVASGATVIALVSSSEKAESLRPQLRLEHVLATDDPGWVDEVKRLTHGRGVDAVIDNVGLVEDSLRCIKFGGRIVIVGFAGRGGIMEKVAMNRVLLRSAIVIGYRFGEQCRQDPQHLQEAWQGYYNMLESGKIKALIDHHSYQGLEDIPKALQDLADRTLRARAVVTVEQRDISKL